MGNYAITISQAGSLRTLGSPKIDTYTDNNYTLALAYFVPGTLTITLAPLTIMAETRPLRTALAAPALCC